MSRELGRSGARNAGKLFLALSLSLAAAGCTPMDDLMAAVFGRSMRDQPSFDPYENTRMPAEGSVPFASGNLQTTPYAVNIGHPDPMMYDLPSFTNSQTDLMGIAAAIPNPVPATPESLERGKEMFERYCAVCHGLRGQSAQAPIIEKHPVMMAFNLAMGAATTYSDGYLYGMIRVGRGLMPPYGHQVPHFDRWHIVNYVRTLQAGGAAPAPAADSAATLAPPPPGGN